MKIDLEKFSKHFIHIDYTKIRPFLQKNKSLRDPFTDIIIQNKDIELAYTHCLTGYYDKDLLAFLPFDLRSDVTIKETVEEHHYFYYSDLNTIYAQDELPKLLKKALVKAKTLLDPTFIGNIFKETQNKQLLLDTIQSVSDIKCFPLTAETVFYLDKNTRTHLIKSGIYPDVILKYEMYHYSPGSNVNFWDVFNRKEINDLNISMDKYYMCLAHVMTKEELEEFSDKFPIFIRKNLKYLSYGYLKKFKEKKAFKALVGDCRDRANARFANELAERLNLQNSLDFILGD